MNGNRSGGPAADLADIGRREVVGFEATGNYHRTLAHRLPSAGFELRLISSVALARTREALHNGWDKNDAKDAQVILHMLRIGATQRYIDPLAARINDLQETSKTHEAISEAKDPDLASDSHALSVAVFSEIERFAGNIRFDWFLALIERFPTPCSITSIGREAFTEQAWPPIGRQVCKVRVVNDIMRQSAHRWRCPSTKLPPRSRCSAWSSLRLAP